MPRTWSRIEIKINYGYFASFGSVTITCYSDGQLSFEGEPCRFAREESRITDNEHFITKASLKKIDTLVEAILTMEVLEQYIMDDGPCFDCTVHFENGIIKGFGYVSAELHPEHGGDLEKNFRKILRERFFLKKYQRVLIGIS